MNKIWTRFGEAGRTAVLAAVVGGTLMASQAARADGVGNVLVRKSIPPATVALIDPESGTSQGGGTTDVRIAPGDVISFRFAYLPVPDKQIRGLAGYLTEYIPSNTQVVGVRLIDQNGLTVRPNFPGIAVDGCARPCNNFNSVPWSGGTRNLDDGSIAQVYADTGIFYTAANPLLAKDPLASFITLQNGIVMPDEPLNIAAIKLVYGLSQGATPYAHNLWDLTQAMAYGTQNGASGNRGTGNTPFGYGSVVAGPQTHYPYEASRISSSVTQFNDTVGPWNRIVYPGSQIGSGSAVATGGTLKRMNIDVPANLQGFDVTPANPLPVTANAVRFASGELRVGEPVHAEVFLRVLATPLDGNMGKDADCAETFGGDTSGATDNTRARDNPWPVHLASPSCTFLNLMFDLDVDKTLVTNGETLTYSLRGKNLSLNPQTNVVVRMRYDSTDVALVGGTPTASPAPVLSTCGAFSCITWTLGTLAPSQEYTLGAQFTTGGGGHVTQVMFADYTSTQLSGGFTTQALTVNRPITRPALVFSTPGTVASGATLTLTGTLGNLGSGSGDLETLTFGMPAGWAVTGATLGAEALVCTTNTCSIPSKAFGVNDVRALSVSVAVPGAASDGLYPLDVDLWGSQGGFGGPFQTYFNDVVVVAVNRQRSTVPVITCPIPDITTIIRGTSSEDAGTTIRLYFNGIPRGDGLTSGGAFSVGNFSTFGTLYGGLEVRASAQNTGTNELESELSAPCFVSFTPVCANLKDDDSDGATDFPTDPGCESPEDNSEANPVFQCSDTVDNDNDNTTDYPADLSCSSPLDPSETGPPACGDTVDNDGDGAIDFPNDTGCTDAADPNELDLAACQDGVDNDNDGRTDFPVDLDCHAAIDNDELPIPMSLIGGEPRILIAFDTSGSMNWNTCDQTFTGGDGSNECAGTDVACAACSGQGCGNNEEDDSRLYKVKAGVSDAVKAFGEVDFALMRFQQRSVPFQCAGTNASLRSGGWQGAGAGPCTGFNGGDVVTSFAMDNRLSLLSWMDNQSNYTGTPPAGMDVELRGSGLTPLAGILRSAKDYLAGVRGGDLRSACRPYRVVLVTDGMETCDGVPGDQARELFALGIPVTVIGFATQDQNMANALNVIASEGGTGQAILVEDSATLASEIARLVSESLRFESCNGMDDDCDGLTDEDFPEKNRDCDNGRSGICLTTGKLICSDDGRSLVCNAGPGQPGVERCPPNGVDDDCNGVVDDIPGGCAACTPEVCNGLDDDCDGTIDEADDIFPCANGIGSCPPPCGSAIGICLPGILACTNGVITCGGGVLPGVEVCDGSDNNCDGVIDGFIRICYPSGAVGCDATASTCVGLCRLGREVCPQLQSPAASNMFGACAGATTPLAEICNLLDDDCNGMTDDGIPGGCDKVCIPTPEICNGADDNCNGVIDDNAMGVGEVCVVGFPAALAGIGVCKAGAQQCVAGQLTCRGSLGPRPEICDGIDTNCDGELDAGTTCPGTGFGCAMGGCQPECGSGEFNCPSDRVCARPDTLALCTDSTAGCLCLPDLCVKAKCNPASQICVLEGAGVARCQDRCPEGQCAAGQVCNPRTGACLDCYRTGCPAGQVCLDRPGRCVANPCAGVQCGPAEYCQDGNCRAVCDSSKCPTGQTCIGGECKPTACTGEACGTAKVCNPQNGVCENDPCAVISCLPGTRCVSSTGQCAVDACAKIGCPKCNECALDFLGSPQCRKVAGCEPPVVITEIAAQGGGGCSCAVFAPSPPAGPGWSVMALGVLLGLRVRARRRLRNTSGGGR